MITFDIYFLVNDIDMNMLEYLQKNKQLIKELIPKMGTRINFEMCLNNWVKNKVSRCRNFKIKNIMMRNVR